MTRLSLKPALEHNNSKITFDMVGRLTRNSHPLIIVVIALTFVVLKLKGFNVDNTLWAEDGQIFINQAREFGFASIWMPYAGYLHLYPRLVAWLSSFFDLTLTPLIFFIGWVLAYLSLIYITSDRLLRLGFSANGAALISILIVAQPHSGEVFFNLTNAQWFMGAALAIYLLVPVKDTTSTIEKLVILTVSLTGPFSLLLMPILLMQLIIYRDWEFRKFTYFVVFLAATIQLLIIMFSSRIQQHGFDTNVHDWLTVFYTFFTFGKKPLIPLFAALCFWTTSVLAFVLVLPKELSKNVRLNYNNIGISASLLVLSAGTFFLASVFADMPSIAILSAMGHGARYFFIPYALIFVASVLVASKQPKLLVWIYSSLIVLALSSFTFFKGTDLQLKAYVEFAKLKDGVSIPIRPERQWNITVKSEKPQDAGFREAPILLSTKSAKMHHIVSKFDGTQYFEAIGSFPYLAFEINSQCELAKYIGIEVTMPIHEGGDLGVSLVNGAGRSTSKPLFRYAASEDRLIHFALPMQKATQLRFYPPEYFSKFKIDSVKLYCL